MNEQVGQNATSLGEKVAVITGASRGIGRAIALGLAAEGCAVALAARSARRLEQLAGEIESKGDRAVAIPTDLTVDRDLSALIEIAQEDLGRIDILINNAGIRLSGPIERFPTRHWDAMMTVNARAPFILSRLAIPHLRAAGGGAIVNISSIAGIQGFANQAAYGASKHALMGLSKALAAELKADGIRVHTVCPGGVDTDMAADSPSGLDRATLIAPGRIAEVVLFLLRLGGNAMIDDVHVRRAAGNPWF